MRIGFGYDVHQLTAKRPLILGGVRIPYEFGLLGHSDADVLVHAVMDAMLGAAGLGDIGQHFPDTDETYRGADSIGLLAEVKNKLSAAGWRVGNIDAVIVAQKPKLAEFIPEMRRHCAEALAVPQGAVNIKATTTENLGFEGRREGISAYAVCLIEEG